VRITNIAGHTAYAMTGPTGTTEELTSYQDASGDHYLIPDEARPYLGKQLSTSLFDVSALLRDGLTTGTHIPINLAFDTGTTRSAPPGVTLTSHGTSNATGYLTPQSGAAFAAGLRAAIGADVTAGRSVGIGTLFGGVASISLAALGNATSGTAASGTGKSNTVQPRYPLHILQVNATDLTGAPATAVGAVLVNTDSVSRENVPLDFTGGIDRVAVPVGDYSVLVQFLDFDTSGNLAAVRTVLLDDFTVPATGPTTAINVDERTATVALSVATPRPATKEATLTSWLRQDATGVTTGVQTFVLPGGPPVYTNSQPAPKVGKLRYVSQWAAAGPATGAQYRYDLAFGSDDVPANQSYVARPGQLATVRQVISSDPGAAGSSILSATADTVAIQQLEVGSTDAYSGLVTQYLGSGDGGQWIQSTYALTGLGYDGDVHTYAAGRSYQVQWTHGPLAPNVGQHTGPTDVYPCFVCASANALGVFTNFGSDSEPDHTTEPPGVNEVTHLTIYRNGTVIADVGSRFVGAELTGIPSGPATYREVFDTDLTGVFGVTQSTNTHTDITFISTPGTDWRTTLPASDRCDFTGAVTAPCQVQPILTLNYHLASDDENTSASPVQLLKLNVGHLTYDGRGSHAPITSATVSVSFDSGKTWQPAFVTGAFGKYVALWQNPSSAAGTSPELRVTATDAVGGSISQTDANAYTIAAAASVH
jgi:hypothetical protein